MSINQTKYKDLDLAGIEKTLESGSLEDPLRVRISSLASDIGASVNLHELSQETGRIIHTNWHEREVTIIPTMTRDDVYALFGVK